MLGRDTNKICFESCPSSSSPGSSYDEFGDFERKGNKKRDLVTFKSKERDTRPRLGENDSGPLPLPFQCCNRLFKDSTDLAMHQKSYTHQSYQMDRLDIDEQMKMDQSPVRIEWLRRLMDFMADRGSPLMHCSILPGSEDKRPLDLYKFYNLVQLYGLGRGSNNCSSKAWNDISELMGVSPENTHDLQRLFDRCLLPYEDAGTWQKLEDVNFNSPSRVSQTVLDRYSQDEEDNRNRINWKRKFKKNKKFEKKQRLSVFKRLGKKK